MRQKSVSMDSVEKFVSVLISGNHVENQVNRESLDTKKLHSTKIILKNITCKNNDRSIMIEDIKLPCLIILRIYTSQGMAETKLQ